LNHVSELGEAVFPPAMIRILKIPHCLSNSKIILFQNRRKNQIDTLAHKYMTAHFPVLVQVLQQKSGGIKLALYVQAYPLIRTQNNRNKAKIIYSKKLKAELNACGTVTF
jgi:hypothetical protein